VAEEVNQPPARPSKPRVEVERCGAAWVITLHGEHDVSTQSLLRDQLDQVREAGGPIVVDLSRAGFVDSTVIGALVLAWQQGGGDFALVAPTNYEGTRLVELIGIGSVIPVHPTRTAAIASLGE
jgi:anti-sigma B factor antagonist